MRRLPPRQDRQLRPSFLGFEAIGPVSVLIPMLPAAALAELAAAPETAPSTTSIAS